MIDQPNYDKAGTYEIRVKGELTERWSDWFDGFGIKHHDGETILIGMVMDQSALHGLLNKIRDLGLTLVSVQKIESKND